MEQWNPERAPREKPCPDCGGKGRVKDQSDPEGKREKTCERCGGRGMIVGW